MKTEFIEFLNALMTAAPDVVENLMTDNVRAYILALTEAPADKPVFPDNGKMILQYMQDNVSTPIFRIIYFFSCSFRFFA